MKNKIITISFITTIFVAALLLASPPIGAGDWPMWRNDAGNAGTSTEEITLPLTEAWHTNAPDVEENGCVVANGIVYLQVSRGAGPRNFYFDGVETPPTVVCLARSQSPRALEAGAAKGIAVKSMPDMRWGRCDIKTVMLLPASLAKESARAEGAQEAWFLDAEGNVREGGSSNAWIITPDDKLVTPPATNAILRGITRTTLIDLIEREGLTLEERPFTIEEAQNAREAFITSASNLVMPVVSVDARPIGNGHPGSLTERLRAAFHEVAQKRQLA